MSEQGKKLNLAALAEQVMEGARKRGAKGVRVSVGRSRDVSVVYRKGKIDKITESMSSGLAVHVYIDGRYSTSSTSDLRLDALEDFLDTAVAMAKAMKPDPYRTMPDPRLYQGRQDIDLKLYDDSVSAVTPESRKEYAAKVEAAAMEAAGEKAVSAEGGYSESEGESFRIHSNGFSGSRKGTTFWGYAEVTVKDEGDKRPSGWAEGGSRFAKDLRPPEEVAKDAVEHAMSRCKSKKLPTGKYTMVVENRVVGRFLSYMLRAAYGRALQQKRSFLEGMQGKKIGGDLLTLIDDPFIPSGFGSRLFDGEGIAAKKFPVFDKGVFKNFYIDTYYGKKLGMQPTTGDPSNLVIPPGNESLDELLAGIDQGILVRGFIGGNSNSTTGDFSIGVYGTHIVKGKPAGAVAEMNVAGNHREFWKKLEAVASDPYPYSDWVTPSLIFEDVTFSGA